jgi:ferrous iron transport protein A
MTRPLSTLKPGESGVVDHLELPQEVLDKLLEMGICPGEQLRLIRWSPFGDPVEIEILGYRLALRRSEADHIHIV